MIGRRTQTNRLSWGRRQRGGGRRAEHGARARTTAGEPSVSLASIPPARRQGGWPQDRALYACSCGHAFDALVSTTVDCPQCGSIQAW